MYFEFKSNNYKLLQVYIKTQEIIINDTDQSTMPLFQKFMADFTLATIEFSNIHM